MSGSASGPAGAARADISLVQLGAKLMGTPEIGSGWFGYSVAVSADGNTALVGGKSDNSSVGAAWVFTRSGGTWSPQGPKFTPTDETGAATFGGQLRLSADGNTALVGGSADNASAGAAWVFTRSNGAWKQQGPKLTGGGEVGTGLFGQVVAISGDGATALVGGSTDDSGVGGAWVFTQSGGTWTPQGLKLTDAGVTDRVGFGSAVTVSGDGNTALIGTYGDNTKVGSVSLFARSGGNWARVGNKLTGAGENGGAYFGNAVAFSADAKIAIIGGFEDTGSVGAIWAFGDPSIVSSTPLAITSAAVTIKRAHGGRTLTARIGVSAPATATLTLARRSTSPLTKTFTVNTGANTLSLPLPSRFAKGTGQFTVTVTDSSQHSDTFETTVAIPA